MTKEIDTQVTTIVDTEKGIRAASREISDTLRADIYCLQYDWRKWVLHRKLVLELSETDGQFIAFGHTIICVELLHLTVEIVHKEERPTVGDTSLGPKQRTLHVPGVTVAPIIIHIGIARLGITIEGDAAFQFLRPVIEILLLLCMEHT